MNQHMDRAQIKLAARAAMRQTRPRVWLVTLVLHLVTGAVSGILSALFLTSWITRIAGSVGYLTYGDPTPDQVFSMLFGDAPLTSMSLIVLCTVLTACFSCVMSYGYTAYTLKVWRRQPAVTGDLFSMFSRMLKVIGASFMVGLFSFLWTLLITAPLGGVAGVIGELSGSFVGARALSGLLGVVGAIFAALIVLRYAMTPYWIITDPSCGVMEALRRSKTAMRGNIGKYFVFHLSFIGWYLLIVAIIIVPTVIGMGIAIAQYGNAIAYSSEAMLALVLLTYLGAGIGLLLTIPLQLFLTGYTSVASMGFFDQLAGGGAPITAEQTPPISPYQQILPTQNDTPAPPPVAPPSADDDNWNV